MLCAWSFSLLHDVHVCFILSPSLPLPFFLVEDVQWLTESIQRDLMLGIKPKQSSPALQAKQQPKFLWPNRVRIFNTNPLTGPLPPLV